ncbi:MAG: hypothetical protein HOP15_13810 [Planctomycetes bacterium]|nr:hypothetical protein [Planctomycetota bacterium]
MSGIPIASKMLGDAGEHYALSQLTFAGKPAMKMPEGWEGYDLAYESGTGLVRISVKTRSESEGWSTSRWFTFDDRRECEWIVFVFKPKSGVLRSWILPFAAACRLANQPGPRRKNAHIRDLSWAKLNTPPLSQYESNWNLERGGS